MPNKIENRNPDRLFYFFARLDFSEQLSLKSNSQEPSKSCCFQGDQLNQQSFSNGKKHWMISILFYVCIWHHVGEQVCVWWGCGNYTTKLFFSHSTATSCSCVNNAQKWSLRLDVEVDESQLGFPAIQQKMRNILD